MQPFGSPVVPEVYGSRARSSGPARAGVGTSRSPIASRHRVQPAGSGGSPRSHCSIAGGGASASAIVPAGIVSL
jgi:hypothetical protein